jgi:Ca2+-binding EF-hand superfamily protein
LESVQKLWEQLKEYKKTEKPAKTNDKLGLEESFNNIQTKLRVNNRPPFVPPQGLDLQTIEQLWNTLGQTEGERTEWVRKEIERLLRLENMASRFWKKAKATLAWCADSQSQLSSTDYGDSLSAVEAKLKNHEGFQSSLDTNNTRLGTTRDLGNELIAANYGRKEEVRSKLTELDSEWNKVVQLAADRRAGLEAALNRQRQLENLRLDFATRSRKLVSHFEDAEDALSEPVTSSSKAAVAAVANAYQQYLVDHKQYQTEFDDLVALADQMKAEGITSNMYAQYSIQQLAERWSALQTEVDERAVAIANEDKRQDSNEVLCRAFAEKAKSFVDWCAAIKEEIAQLSSLSVNEQLEALRNKAGVVAERSSAVEEVSTITRQMDEATITHNQHTDITLDEVRLTWEALRDLIAKQGSLLEAELLRQSGSGVSEEQIAEFKETFRNFDKDRSGFLAKHEFKACLSALGYFYTDEQVDQLMTTICKQSANQIYFNEFVEFMIKKNEDSDTPTSILQAFKTIADDRDSVTEVELRRALPAENVDFFLQNIPKNAAGNYDYKAFIQQTYGKH